MSATYDVLVIGVGGMGSAAAYALARRGVRVLGLEQFGPAHGAGSSHGETRIIRTAYFEHPDYVPLLRRSYDLWRELEAESGRSLYDAVGLFLNGRVQAEAIAGTLRAAQEHALSLETLTTAEARRRFPGFAFDADACTVYERDAGRLLVEACVASHIERARAHGAELRFRETVVQWSAERHGVRVLTDRGVYTGERLVFTAGAWTLGLLRAIGVPLNVRRKVQLWFPASDASYRDSPCFYFEEPHGSFYGIPDRDGALVKVAEHTGGDAVDDPALVERKLLLSDVERVAEFVALRLPQADSRPVRHSVCLYTMSPDGHFLVDRHPEHERVAFAAGFSGHGFKFAGVIGEALADLALDGRTDLPVNFLRCDRFGAGVT